MYVNAIVIIKSPRVLVQFLTFLVKKESNEKYAYKKVTNEQEKYNRKAFEHFLLNEMNFENRKSNYV